MQTISIGELQKNISIFNNLKESLKIVDKRRNKVLAIVYPYEERKESIVDELAGKYGVDEKFKNMSFKEIKELAWMEAMKEKYGFSD
jgi:hypothetical protein